MVQTQEKTQGAFDVRTFVDDLRRNATYVTQGGIIDGAELARILSILATLEVKEGGPYGLTIEKHPGDIDLGLNLVVADFLQSCDVRLPNVDAYIENACRQGVTTSRVVDSDMLAKLKAQYVRTLSPQKNTVASKNTDTLSADEAHMMTCIRKEAKERLRHVSDNLANNAMEVMERTIAGNPDKQMSLMAYYMREALGEKGKKFTDEYIAALGLANVFFWTAFIVYDDFWDEDEAAEPRLLPTANFFARHYTDYFSTVLPQGSGFRALFHEIMDKLDAANTWEMHECRMRIEGNLCHIPETLPAYDDFSIKFYPAAGHVLGPVALLVELGYDPESDEVKNLINYFKHYLIAMQLNDDAHDWREDLLRGHISTAVYFLLRRWQERHPEKQYLHLKDDMPELEQFFWFDVLTPLSETVLERAEKARVALGSLTCTQNPAPLEQFIIKNERVAREALDEQKRSTSFLAALST